MSIAERSEARPRPVAISRLASPSIALALFALVAIGPIVADVTAQPVSRYAATAAYAEHGSVDLTPYAPILGIDKAAYRGELRSDKAPGQPVLGVPVYLVGRALGFEPASRMRIRGDLGVWWQTLWGAMLPFVALLVLMHRAAARVAPRSALAATLALGFGTLMLPHAANLYGHTMAALFAFGAWIVLDGSEGSRRRLALAGCIAGCAFAVEYHTAIVGVALFAFGAVRWHRRVGWFGVGFAPPVLFTAVYQTIAFGRPWHLAYSYLVSRSIGGQYGVPTIHQLTDVILGAHGLVLTSPILIVAVAGAGITAARSSGWLRGHCLLALAVFLPYFVLAVGWSGTPLLEQPGPRYLIPALPFLAVPLAVVWARFRSLACICAAWGVAVMGAGALTMHLVVAGEEPFALYLGQVARGEFNPTLWSMTFGRAGGLLYV
ncbi:MAG: hypothetical protein JWL83_668, partial [Actinomycetia bacterium]|nr:hypothetical protein [Actinomycetes bacterium]